MEKRARTVYVDDALWWHLRAKLTAEHRSVSAWFREQARKHVTKPDAPAGDPAFFVAEDKGNGQR